MATVSDLVSPISLDKMKQPVIFESCFHTLGKKEVIGTIRSELEERIGNWDFRIPQTYKCAVCQQNYEIIQIVYNDEWGRLNSLLERYIQTYKGMRSADEFRKEIKNMPLSELSTWGVKKALDEVKNAWGEDHCDQKGEDVTVIDFLEWKVDPLVEKLFYQWKEEFPEKVAENLSFSDLFDYIVSSYRKKELNIFKDIRPVHLLGYDAENHDQQKIKNAPKHDLVFPMEEWTSFESLKFIAASIYHFAVALICEVGLYLLYFWECGVLTTERYENLRKQYVINRIMPLYLKYIGLPTEKPTD